ncbi:MAG: long-chain fatty acid--CoA ligase [Actinobacteria bacterium]|nr:long-chain fatty acid--CoA ligase [Actinomycetota bacterium]
MREYSVPSAAASSAQHNTADFVFANAARRPTHVALRRRTGTGWSDVTAAGFATEVSAVAKGLIAAGVGAGDRIAIMSKTRYEWTLIDFALMTVAAISVPIYETSSAEQVEWILADSGAIGVFVETIEHGVIVESVRTRTSALRHVWAIEDGAVPQLIEQGHDVADRTVDERRGQVRPVDIASIIYTSGTTGRPKGCQLTHANFISEIDELSIGLHEFFNPTTSTLLFLPIAHVFGRAIQLGCVGIGCTLGHTADVKNLIDDLAEFRPTFVLSVPRVFEKVYNTAKQRAHAERKGRIFDLAERIAIRYSQALDTGSVSILLKAQHAVFDKLVYSKLRAALGGNCVAAVSGGAPLGERLGHFFRGVGVTIYEGYGLTETTAGFCVNRPGALKIGTVGPPVGGASARVADDGELLVRGGVVFDGYWNNDAATAEAIDAEGWFHTGDIGEIDDDGYVRITGRKKELIVTANGKNVAPAVLEDRVRAHWLIDQCLVVGDRQPFIAALITIDPEAYPRWLAEHDRAASTPLADLVDDEALRAEIQSAVDEANKSVSQAESIRKFTILPYAWSEDGGQITPSLKLKRNIVMDECAEQIASLYAGQPVRS